MARGAPFWDASGPVLRHCHGREIVGAIVHSIQIAVVYFFPVLRDAMECRENEPANTMAAITGPIISRQLNRQISVSATPWCQHPPNMPASGRRAPPIGDNTNPVQRANATERRRLIFRTPRNISPLLINNRQNNLQFPFYIVRKSHKTSFSRHLRPLPQSYRSTQCSTPDHPLHALLHGVDRTQCALRYAKSPLG